MNDIAYLIQKLHDELSLEGRKILNELIDSLLDELHDIKTKLIVEEDR